MFSVHLHFNDNFINVTKSLYIKRSVNSVFYKYKTDSFCGDNSSIVNSNLVNYEYFGCKRKIYKVYNFNTEGPWLSRNLKKGLFGWKLTVFKFILLNLDHCLTSCL